MILCSAASVIPWPKLDQTFAKHYCQRLGRPAKPIRLMVGLLNPQATEKP